MGSTLPTDRRPLVISGPSGVGKGTLFALLRERHPDTFTLSVSHTTRAPRDGEAHGEHYYFVTHGDFEDLIAKDGFVEHAQFSGNRYGTSKQTIKDQTEKGKVVVLDIEMEGVKQIKQSGMDARYVFVAPPSEEELEKRLRGRGTEKEESVQKRLKQAKLELEYSRTPGVHDLIVSGSRPCRNVLHNELTNDTPRSSTTIWRRPTNSSRNSCTSPSTHRNVYLSTNVQEKGARKRSLQLAIDKHCQNQNTGVWCHGRSRYGQSMMGEQFLCIPAGIKTRL